MALARRLAAEGRYAALYFTCETARVFPDDVEATEKAVWLAITQAAALDLPEALQPPPETPVAAGGFLHGQITRWAQACPRPLVLIFKEESMRLVGFTEVDVRALYAQHTAETGQVFTDGAVARAFELSQGQPWLANALAREVVERMLVPPTEPITAAHIEEAKERVIRTRATHLDSLLARLSEDRVRRIVEPVLAGELTGGQTFDADFEYAVDLGIIAPDLPPRIANPIYREIIVRVLATQAEAAVYADPRSYVAADGRLDMDRLLHEFAEFWREHGELVAGRIDYQEVAPQLVLMAYLHSVVNGRGSVDREVGVGRQRIDLLVKWPYKGAEGERALQRVAMELKVWRNRDKKGDPLQRGLAQLDQYLARLGLSEGVLILFDCRAAAEPIEERTRFEEAETPSGRRVTVLRA